MVEYVTKEEVLSILKGAQGCAVVEGDEAGSEAIGLAIKQIQRLYAVRPMRQASWKRLGTSRDIIFCGGCGYQTLVYKNTAYCPNCGKSMMNGVKK